MEKLLEKGLTCNRIFQHLHFYSTKRFTGKIRVFHHSSEKAWSFYFASGNVIWAHGGNHSIRRWRRRFYAATGQLPNLKGIDHNAECWDCKALRELLESKNITSEEVQKLLKGILLEILFDVIQAFEAPIYEQDDWDNQRRQLLPLSSLTGIGDGMQVEYQRDITPDRYYRLPSSLIPPLEELYDITYQTWKKWVELGLARVSPNDAPLLLNPEAFRNSVSERIYNNMRKALQGYSSLRDLAFQFKHGDDFLKLAQAIAPYVERELIRFQKIQDLSSQKINSEANATISQEISPTITLSEASQDKPLLLMIDNNPKNQFKVNLVAKEYGYQFQVIDDSIKALHQFRETKDFKPQIIFFNPEVSIITEIEFCQIVHRMESFEEIPIVIYSNHEMPRKKAQQALRAGAAEVLDSESFHYRKLKSILVKSQAQTIVQA